MPLYLVRVHHMASSDIALLFGPMLTTGMFAGYVLGGALGHRLALGSLSNPLWLSVVSSVLLTFVYWVILTTHSDALIYVLIFFAGLLSVCHAPAYAAAIQNSVAANVRATATGMMILSNSAIGMALLPFAVGWLSDLLSSRFGENSLGISLIVIVTSSLFAGLAFDFARRSLAADMTV